VRFFFFRFRYKKFFSGDFTHPQALEMALLLRTARVSKKEKHDRITAMLDTLDLTRSRDTRIGSSVEKGVSGGERKRTAIGMELMAGSPVLLLDECTSGLDSFAAHEIVKTLKNIASQGNTVVATLHQPSSQIIELADDLIILVAGEARF
jgi:ABC-type multidrug transport system ATPase subunit